ncbi:hypothetical protein Pfo_007743 [Paulownia fortunei]|nr:hypothetical protein Pfo_007743 [Paulownia fortunei]
MLIYLGDVSKVISSRTNNKFTRDNKVYIVKNIQNKTFPGQKYEVHIINSLPNNSSPLFIHCASKDDDLGNHTLHQKDDFHWHFRINVLLSTLFFCRFRWDSKDKSYDVFNKHLAPNCETYDQKVDGNICVWSIRQDGFWISNQIPPITLVQIYQW